MGGRPPGWLAVEAALARGRAARPVGGRNCTRGAAPTLTSPPDRKALRRTWSVARRRPLGLGVCGGCPPGATPVGAGWVGSAGRAGGGLHTPRRGRDGNPDGDGARRPPAPPDCAPRWSPLPLAGTRPRVFGLIWRGGGKARPACQNTAATGGAPSGRSGPAPSPARPPDHPPAHCLWREWGVRPREPLEGRARQGGSAAPGDGRGGTGVAASCHSEGRSRIGTPFDARQCQLSPVPTLLTMSATVVAPPDPWSRQSGQTRLLRPILGCCALGVALTATIAQA